MTGRDFDTDPSTPGALRGATADTDPAGAPAEAKKPNTDPGVGPPGPPLPQQRAPGGRQDSVEMLLDGMSAPQPERQKMTPQSAGEAAAAYHAEHPVHPARTSPDEEPKVIVERPPLVPTVRVHREQVQAIIEAADEQRRAAEAEEAAKARVPVTMGPRVLIAAVAGLLVVLVIFVVARGSGGAAKETPAASATTAPTQIATATATATPTATPTPTATAAAIATAADTTSEEPAPTPVPTAHVSVTALPTAKPPRPKPAPASSGDLGEFKTTFH